jgi:hypothetical protein
LGCLPKDRALGKRRVAAGTVTDSCYQTCYHFLQKAARNKMNQGPTRWTMSLKYKEQHETRRNINQTHNPKVEGSNPSPATKTPSLSITSKAAKTEQNEAATRLLPNGAGLTPAAPHLPLAVITPMSHCRYAPNARFHACFRKLQLIGSASPI